VSSGKILSMIEISFETLRERLDEYLERARRGEQIFITEQGRSATQLIPGDAESRVTQRAWEFVKAGGAHWAGGKPEISRQRPRLRGGKSASDIVLEDRG
jgi:prevent-host-death family protein